MVLAIGVGFIVAGLYLVVRGDDTATLKMGSQEWSASSAGAFVAFVGALLVIAGILT
jgi:hypothetical protein